MCRPYQLLFVNHWIAVKIIWTYHIWTHANNIYIQSLWAQSTNPSPPGTTWFVNVWQMVFEWSLNPNDCHALPPDPTHLQPFWWSICSAPFMHNFYWTLVHYWLLVIAVPDICLDTGFWENEQKGMYKNEPNSKQNIKNNRHWKPKIRTLPNETTTVWGWHHCETTTMFVSSAYGRFSISMLTFQKNKIPMYDLWLMNSLTATPHRMAPCKHSMIYHGL